MVQTAQRMHRRIDRRTLLRRSAKLFAVAAMGAAPAAAVRPGLAEPGYPNRPVRIIVPYGPGGVADTTMRIVAERLSFKLGQQFIVDNRPGAGGIVAAKAVASSPPDGYVLELTGNGTAISAALFKQLPFDVVRDFTPIGITAFFDLVIVAKADGPLKSVGDIVAAARANPGKLNFGSIAPGSTQNLSAELFKSVADVNAAVVTYRTSPELVTGLLRGDIQVGFEYYAGVNAAVRDGKLMAVATTGAHRTPALPAVPTVRESGLPGYVVESWNALSGPAGMPDDIVRLLNRAANEVLQMPEVQEKARLFGMEARGTTPDEMQSRLKADIEKWAAVIEKAGLERQ
jgi:tripartite-type tricarboxylate transporter receptor subunit TctC